MYLAPTAKDPPELANCYVVLLLSHVALAVGP